MNTSKTENRNLFKSILMILIIMLLLSLSYIIYDTYKNRKLPNLLKNKLTLVVGDIVKIQNNLPKEEQDKLLYFSQNDDVATVDKNGNVKAINWGNTAIVVKYKRGQQEMIEVNVKSKDKSIIINQNKDMELIKGEIKHIIIENNEENLKFQSLNKNIATVDNAGNVKAIEAGETSILINSEYKLKVKVIGTYVKNIIASNIDIPFGKESQIEYQVVPSNASNSIKFIVEDKNIIEVNSTGKIKTINKGKTKVKIESSNGVHKNIEVRVY